MNRLNFENFLILEFQLDNCKKHNKVNSRIFPQYFHDISRNYDVRDY